MLNQLIVTVDMFLVEVSVLKFICSILRNVGRVLMLRI